MLIILLAGLLVSVLFNIRTIIVLSGAFRQLKDTGLIEGGMADILNSGIGDRIKFSFFNLIIEFIVFVMVAYFNYLWLEKIVNYNELGRLRTPFIIFCNLILFFILIPPGKWFHSAYFAPLEVQWNKEIEFDIQNYLIINISVFLLAVLVANLLIIMRKMHFAQSENIRLVEEKSKAELSVLKEQISPHFFFNTMSTLSTIVRNSKKEEALVFIDRMSHIYRYTLSIKNDLVTVGEELDFIDAYVFLMQERYGDKLDFKNEVDKSAHGYFIPPMSLQLLAENALRHNIITRESPFLIRVFIEDGMICLENDLREKPAEDTPGIGLKNLSDRYRLLAGEDIVITKEKGKFRVNLPLIQDEGINSRRRSSRSKEPRGYTG